MGVEHLSAADGCQNEMKLMSAERLRHYCEIWREKKAAEGNISKKVWHQVALLGLIYCQELSSFSFSADKQ